MGNLTYFAYGSNMLEERLRQRSPSARATAVARLEGWTLSFHKRSKDGSGKASIAPSEEQDATVYGVLYELDSSDLEALDRFEGYGSGYDRRSIDVTIITTGETVTAMTYLASEEAIDPSLSPYDWYLKLIIAGAKEHSLPESYVEELAGVHANSDPIQDRPAQREALALLKKVQKP
ncbi:gamma-glutamylcyclotransferase family protein [Shinella sp. S4-D37]|uniref:gamma-glutamylcyclotransferase family protein n=1 Tax=Shinella sp. S4-D37 TaxID=3161999 RepID=UPI0034667E1F